MYFEWCASLLHMSAEMRSGDIGAGAILQIAPTMGQLLDWLDETLNLKKTIQSAEGRLIDP